MFWVLYSWFCEAYLTAPADRNPGDKFILILFPIMVFVIVFLVVEVILMIADEFS